MPIPGERKPRGDRFQTKDLHNTLDQYTIKANGTLEGPFGPMEFHGYLGFHTFECVLPRDPKSPGIWYEYRAKFTDGKLMGIECLEVARMPFGGPREILEGTRVSQR